MPRPLIADDAPHHAEDPILRVRQRDVGAVRSAGGIPVAVAAWFSGVPPDERDHASARHPIQAREGSKPGRTACLGVCATTDARHHRALRTVPPPWIGAALDDEGPVEAIERPDRRFALWAQWHPEIPEDDPTAQEPHGARPYALVQAARTLSIA